MSQSEFVRGGGDDGSSGGPEILNIEFPDGVTTVSDTHVGFGPESGAGGDLEFTTEITIDPEGGEVTIEYRTDGSVGLTIQDAVRELLDRDLDEPFAAVATFDRSDFGPLLSLATRAKDTGPLQDPLTRRAVEMTIEEYPILDFGRRSIENITSLNETPLNTQMDPAQTFFDIGFFLPDDRVLVGEDPAISTITIPFEPVVIPDLDPIRNNLDVDQTLDLTFRLKPTNFFDSIVTASIYDLPRVDLSVPLSAFIGYASINTDLDGFFECLEIANDPDRLESLQNDITGRIESRSEQSSQMGEELLEEFLNRTPGDRLETAQDLFNVSLEDLREQNLEERFSDVRILNASTINERVVRGGMSLDDLSPERLLSSDVTQQGGSPQSIEDAAYNAVVSVLRPVELIADEIRDYRSFVRDQFDSNSDCYDEFISVADNAEDSLADVVEAIDRATNFETPEMPDLPDCSDISNAIRNEVSRMEDEAERLQSRSPVDIDFGIVENLMSESEEIRNRIRSEVDSANPCKDQLEDRIDNSQSVFDNLRETLDLDCSDIDNSIRSTVDDLEDEANRLADLGGFNIEEGRVDQVRSDIQSTRSRIEDEVADHNPCKNDLLQRTRGAERLLSSVRELDFGDLPCSAQFPDAEESIRELEEFVDQPRSVLQDAGEQPLLERVSNARDDVYSNVEGDCLSEMDRRIDQLYQRGVSRIDGLRVRDNILSEARERRGNIIDMITGASEGIDGDFEIPDREDIEEIDTEIGEPEIELPDFEEINEDIDG